MIAGVTVDAGIIGYRLCMVTVIAGVSSLFKLMLSVNVRVYALLAWSGFG